MFSQTKLHHGPSFSSSVSPNPLLFFSSSPPITVLVLIDVQPDLFSAARNTNLIYALKKACTQAVNAKQYILIVNYKIGKPKAEKKYPLHPDLQELIGDYPHTATIWKTTDCGAAEILAHLNSNKISASRVCISGVNVCACVKQTVVGLSEMQNYFLIEVDKFLCDCDCRSSPGVCAYQTVKGLELRKYVVRTDDAAYLKLKFALMQENSQKIKQILLQYSEQIPGYIEYLEKKSNASIAFIELTLLIRRDLLESLFWLKSSKISLPDDDLEKIKQLLDTLQTFFSKVQPCRNYLIM